MTLYSYLNWCILLLQIANMQKERNLAIAQRDRLERIRIDRDEFMAKLKKERQSVYKVQEAFFVSFQRFLQTFN